MKKLVKWLLILLSVFVLIIGSYVAYVLVDYHRIPDKQALTVTQKATKEKLVTNHNYCIATYNIGFGAYLPDFSFFMDGGKSSWAKSKKSVQYAVSSAGKTIKKKRLTLLSFKRWI